MTWITTPGRDELLHYGKIFNDDEIEKDGHFMGIVRLNMVEQYGQ